MNNQPTISDMRLEAYTHCLRKDNFNSSLGVNFYYQKGHWDYIAISINLLFFTIALKHDFKSTKK